MIGHYLNNLTPEQEDAVLTTVMRPLSYIVVGNHGPCLRGVAEGFNGHVTGVRPYRGLTKWESLSLCIESRYDRLCVPKTGPARTAYINALIRNRIMSNRAWRALHAVQEQGAGIAA